MKMEKSYIGMVEVKAESMSLGEYNLLRGWKIPENEDPCAEGYYVSFKGVKHSTWMPKFFFEDIYKPVDNLNFGLALKALDSGVDIERKGWNGKGMYVTKAKCMTTTGDIKVENDCLLLKNVHGGYNTWIPSITDLLAEDWCVHYDEV